MKEMSVITRKEEKPSVPCDKCDKLKVMTISLSNTAGRKITLCVDCFFKIVEKYLEETGDSQT